MLSIAAISPVRNKLFAFILLFLMSLLYYKVGLHLRERVMAYPMIYYALAAVSCCVRKRIDDEGGAPTPYALMLAFKAHRPVPEL